MGGSIFILNGMKMYKMFYGAHSPPRAGVEELDDLEAIFLAQIHEQKYKNGSALIVSNDHFKYHCSLEFHTTYVLQYAISPCGAHFSPCKHALFPSGCYPLSRRTYVFYGDFDEEI